MTEKSPMHWFDMSGDPHSRTFVHGSKLSSLPTEWERELAALWRLEADVNNGAYLQFLCNWGHESYLYASQALKKIGATTMARIIDQCQSLVDEYWLNKTFDYDRMLESLPENVSQRILDLSYEFMDYPDNIEMLGIRYYSSYLNAKEVDSDSTGS